MCSTWTHSALSVCHYEGVRCQCVTRRQCAVSVSLEGSAVSVCHYKAVRCQCVTIRQCAVSVSLSGSVSL